MPAPRSAHTYIGKYAKLCRDKLRPQARLRVRGMCVLSRFVCFDNHARTREDRTRSIERTTQTRVYFRTNLAAFANLRIVAKRAILVATIAHDTVRPSLAQRKDNRVIYGLTFTLDPEDESSSWLNEPIKFAYGNSIYVIYPMEKTWEESSAFCNERGSVLAYMNDINITNLIVEAMGDHPKGV